MMSQELLALLREAVGDTGSLLILPHNNPDPDAIVSALALQHVLEEKLSVQSSIAYQGIIGRAENRALVRYLNHPLQPITSLDWSEAVPVALVDTQPLAGNVTLPPKSAVAIVIDHHDQDEPIPVAIFSDIRPELGATSTILVEYLQAAGLEPTPSLATALFYGIKTNTMGLGRNASPADTAAYLYLQPRIDTEALAKDEYRLVFRSAEHQITFIEENEARCNELEQRYHVPIYQGDGTKKEILEQVGVDNVDVAIAASSDDGRNVITALQAKRLGMSQVIAIVQDPDYIPLLEENGVVAMSAPLATAAMVENYLDRPGVSDLFEIGTGIASLLGVFVPEGAQVVGKQIRDINIPTECVVAAVIRGKKFVVPRGNTQINADDHVIFVGPTSAIKDAQDTFLLSG